MPSPPRFEALPVFPRKTRQISILLPTGGDTSTVIANYGDWDFLFANALLEPDGDRLPKRISAAEAVLRALNEDASCTDVLQRLAATRGAINSLTGELMEDHIRNHMPRKTKSAEEAADDLIEIVRTYLK